LVASDEYLTVGGRGAGETKVKGSRFIATVAPVRSEDEARSFVQQVSRRYFDATHNCYAYRLGLGDRAIFRYSDAGEPAGTAGRSILEAIESRQLTNTAVVVSRYFGGTKLGTGGLAKVYRESTRVALEEVGTIKAFLSERFALYFPYRWIKEVCRFVEKYGGQILAEKYDSRVSLEIRVRRSQSENLRNELTLLGRGEMIIEPLEPWPP
jgi:uncharacterized YigZ family protein